MLVMAAGWLAAADGDDWPCYQKDARRSAATAARLTFPMGMAWTVQLPKPSTAWPEPGRTVNMFDFDYCHPPVVAKGLVYVGSSADDTLYCLDARDGSAQWTFTAAAPIRFAPHIDGGRCFVASDDGCVYCLDARTGARVWEYQAVPRNRMVCGNGRMISRWPCRSGVLVLDGTVYATAGMWPSEGVFFVALDAATGKPRWCNDTTGAMYLPFGHEGLSFGGPTPQGYLACDGKVLVVPAGQSAPAGLDAQTGRLLYWNQASPGSTWVSLGEDVLLVAARGWQGDQEPRLGEAFLQPQDGIAVLQTADGRPVTGTWPSYAKLASAVRKERLRGEIGPISGRDRITGRNGRYFLSGMGVVECIDASSKTLAQRWSVECARVYSLACTDQVVVVAADRQVLALDADSGATIWSAGIPGQARGLALVNGAIYVATDRGALIAFATGRQATAAVAGMVPAAPPAQGLPNGLAIDATARGFALVLGTSDTAIAEAIARASQMHVLCLLKDREAVPAARRALLDRPLGMGVTVHAVPADGTLPYADYFADLVVVMDGTSGVGASELYRVLHPCTGVMRFIGMPAAAAAGLARQSGAPAAEITADAATCTIQRGKLPGAFDWDAKTAVDERVRWPLELLWYGGPGRDRMLARHTNAYPPPVPAAGRVFVQGEAHVIAVDAYHGTELWAWSVPGYRSFAADDRSLWITTARNGVVQCDARNGRIQKVYGKVQPLVFALDQPCRFTARKDNKYSGAITVARTPTDIEVTLAVATPTPSNADYWRLYFDFRTPAERLLPSGRGKFPVFVATTKGVFIRYDLSPDTIIPEVGLARRPGGELVVSVPIEQLRRLLGRIPDSFDLSAQIALFADGKEQPRLWLDQLPLTNGADLLQNGTATFVIAGAKDAAASPVSLLEVGSPEAVPAYAREWGRAPLYKRHDGNIPIAPLAAGANLKLKDRLNTLTGEKNEAGYLRAYGCSGTISSATMDFFRSGTFGMYDLADDSGMRNFPGMKPGCRITIAPALGVVVAAEGTADCFCPYSFATTLALAPAAARRNEDWSIFHGRMKPAPIQRLALNLGAPGDRKDAAGTLWFGYPRQPMMFATGGALGHEPHAIDLPVTITAFPGAHALRVNADRNPLEGSATPWVSASALLGIRTLTMDLVYYENKTSCLIHGVAPPPLIDGVLKEATWSEDAGLAVGVAGVVNPRHRAKAGEDAPEATGTVRLRRDADHLYVAYEQAGTAITAKVKDDQGAIWKDDHCDLALKGTDLPFCVQFGMAAGGGRYSADKSAVIPIPRITGITIDGKGDDWGAQGVELPLPENRGAVRLGWTPEGLVVRTTLGRDFFSYDRAATALRTQFINAELPAVIDATLDAAGRKAGAVQEFVLAAGMTTGQKHDLDAYRTLRPLDARTATATGADGAVVQELLVPLERLGLKAQAGARLALCHAAFDPHATDRNITSGVGACRFVLAGGAVMGAVLVDAPAGRMAIRPAPAQREFFGSVLSFSLPERPIPTDAWRGAVVVDGNGFRSEWAIPLTLLNAAGLSLDRVQVAFRNPGRIPAEAEALQRAFARSYRLLTPQGDAAPSPHTVRLHFAELDPQVQAGQRVFDIRIQGQVVAADVDVVREAGGPLRTVVKEFRGIVAGKVLEVAFAPKGGAVTGATMPILNGIEVLAER